MGVFFKEDLHSGGIVIVIKKGDLFTDQGDRGFIEATIEGDRSILCNDSQGAFTEEIFEIGGGGAKAFEVRGESLQRSLTRDGMACLMVALLDPTPEGAV